MPVKKMIIFGFTESNLLKYLSYVDFNGQCLIRILSWIK